MICELLAREKLSRQQLADRLGKSKGFVSQLLNGERNMTLRTLADLAHALDYRLRVTADVPRSLSTAERDPEATDVFRELKRSTRSKHRAMSYRPGGLRDRDKAHVPEPQEITRVVEADEQKIRSQA